MSCNYTISKHTKENAKKLNVYVKHSTNKNKKLDVFDKKSNKKIASIGACGMLDYPSYLKSKGLAYAQKRRRLYKVRHNKDRLIKGSNGYYADKLLW